MKHLIAAAVAAALLASAGPAASQEKLTVWWVKGFYKSEDDALLAAIKKYEQKTGVKVELSQYAVQDMIPKTVSALDAGTPPDVAYADVYDFQVTGKWAYDGKLDDISDVIKPIKDRFAPNTVETTYLYNDKAKNRAYYAFPLKQQTMHIEYWKDMLDEGRPQGVRHPADLEGVLVVLVRQGRSPPIEEASGSRAFGIGQPMGVDSSDSFYSFLTFVDAYNVKLVDDDGKVLVDDPKVKQGLVDALQGLHRRLHEGLHAALVDKLEGPGQQRRLPQQDDRHDAQRHDLDRGQVARRHEQRDALGRAARAGEEELLRTHRAPRASRKKPDGSPMVYRAAVKTGVDVRGRPEQEARQGVRHVPAARRTTSGHMWRVRSGAGSRSPRPARRARSGRPTRTARRLTTSSRPAP